ncbi:MAG TPA: glycerophosphodiester phosphodiesterase [Cytophagales bacterium]|nr:glycerophosphodiester phosphodiesterase [Cytophagales bacterium]HAA17772.1 glycerophosphodiester phosphodiesterase [Cytophagales bacterium]HAP59852.1 glycerophosphodiester phosphodiesterase [Cytophagales bacterium]
MAPHLMKKLSVLPLFCILLWGCESTKTTTEKDPVSPDGSPETVTAITSFDQWLADPQPMVSAHRGGPYPGYPENAIETFQHVAAQTSTVIECDVSMTQDSVLVLMHDETLDRTTTGTGKVTEVRFADLQTLLLVDNEGDTTNFRVPTLDETLAWGKGKVLFTLDAKRGVPFEKVIAAVEQYDADAYAAIITYRIQDAEEVYRLNPQVMISVSAGSEGALEQIVNSGIPSENLLGFVGTREPDEAHYERVREMGIKTILGTLGNLDKSAEAKGDDRVYLTYVKNGANIIATDRPLEVARVLGSLHEN